MVPNDIAPIAVQCFVFIRNELCDGDMPDAIQISPILKAVGSLEFVFLEREVIEDVKELRCFQKVLCHFE